MPLESSMINLIGIKKFSLKFLIKRLVCYLLGGLEGSDWIDWTTENIVTSVAIVSLLTRKIINFTGLYNKSNNKLKVFNNI